jgi:hypothetical protein
MAEFDDRDEGRQDAFTAIGLTRLLANASLQSPGPCRPQARVVNVGTNYGGLTSLGCRMIRTPKTPPAQLPG